MSRRTAVLVLAVAAATTAAVSYAVVSLPEAGEARRPVVPFEQWAAQRSISRQVVAAQCAAVNETAADRAWCLRHEVGHARRLWHRSEAMPERWTAVELSLKRELYLVVGAYVLFAFVVALLAVRVVARLASGRRPSALA